MLRAGTSLIPRAVAIAAALTLTTAPVAGTQATIVQHTADTTAPGPNGASAPSTAQHRQPAPDRHCSQHAAAACSDDPACFWVAVFGTVPGAPTAGFCTRRLTEAELAGLGPPELPKPDETRPGR